MYQCQYVYWKETDYDVMSGHSSYKPICSLTNKYYYWYNARFCKCRKENALSDQIMELK